jgi:hypothetical protein
MKVQYLRELIWERIGDRWLVSGPAAILFLVSAIASILVVVVALIDLRAGKNDMPSALVLCGVFGTLILWTGMEHYWAKCDSEPRAARRVWFLVVTFVVFLGPALYYAFVYFPQVRRNWRKQ